MPSDDSMRALSPVQPRAPRRREPPWWAKCREKHRFGASIAALAAEFKRAERQVLLVIGGQEALDQERARQRALRPPRGRGKRTSHSEPIVEARKPRVVRRIIADPQTIRAAAEKFARGKITRERFMGIVSAGAPANG